MARKVLVLDLENTPFLAYTFDIYNANIQPIQVLEEPRVISFAAGWADKKNVEFYSEFEGFGPYPTREACHRHMIEQAFRLLDECDVLVTYNGDRHDIPHLYREFENYGLGKPSPFISVDLYKVEKRVKWGFRRLKTISAYRNLTRKIDNSGWALWLGVLSPEPEVRRKAWLEMRPYNKGDVVTTRELFHANLHNITNMPSAALYRPDNGAVACPNCDSDNVHSRGFAVSKTRKYHRYQCQDCSKWFRGTRSVDSVTVTT